MVTFPQGMAAISSGAGGSPVHGEEIVPPVARVANGGSQVTGVRLGAVTGVQVCVWRSVIMKRMEKHNCVN